LIGVDKPVSEKVIKEVEKLKSVVQVKCLNFKII
jgi:hypothetical protein